MVDQFLRLLFGDIGGLIEIRPIEDKKGGKPVTAERCWLTLDELIERRAGMRDRFQAEGWAFFFGVLPRLKDGGGKAEHAAPGRVAWVDVDFKDFDSEAQARATVADLPMPPTVVVASGHGLHLYWVLSEEQRPGDLSLLSDALQLRVGGDACFDAARILRLPGSWNVKDRAHPRQVTIEDLDERRVYHWPDLAEMHQDDLRHAGERLRARTSGCIAGKPLDLDPTLATGADLPDVVADLHARFARLEDLFRGRGKQGGDVSGSGYDFSYTLALLAKGITDPQVLLSALAARQRAVGRSPRARDLTRCVERAVALHGARAPGPAMGGPAPADDWDAPWRDMPPAEAPEEFGRWTDPRSSEAGSRSEQHGPDGLAILSALVDQIEAADPADKLARQQPLIDLYSDPERLAFVVAAWRACPGPIQGALLRLGCALTQAAASQLQRRIRDDAEKVEAQLRAPRSEDPADRGDAPVFEWGDEPEFADRLMGDMGGQDMVAVEADRIYRFDPAVGTWDEVDQGWLRGKFFHKYERAWIRKEVEDKKTGATIEQWKPVKLSSRLAGGVVSVLQDKTVRRKFLLLPQPTGVPFANGLLELDGTFRPFRLDDYIREGQRLHIDYDRGAACLEWMHMLRRIWPEKRPDGTPCVPTAEFVLRVQMLQEFFGAAMFGLATKYQKVLVLVGTGQNGKSVVSKVLRALFPPSVCTSVPIQRMGHEYYTEMLLNSRVNVVGELPAADVYEASGFKDIVDGGTVSARRIKEAPITFEAKAAHMFAANSLPPVTDHSDGFWRRWMALDFPRKFAETDLDYDPDILDKVLKELPGIARWVTDGVHSLIARKRYVDLAASTGILDAWKVESNSVAMFASERLAKDPATLSPATEVYRAYSAWCTDYGFKPVNVTNFGRRLTEGCGFEKRRTNAGMFYLLKMPLVEVKPRQQYTPW